MKIIKKIVSYNNKNITIYINIFSKGNNKEIFYKAYQNFIVLIIYNKNINHNDIEKFITDNIKKMIIEMKTIALLEPKYYEFFGTNLWINIFNEKYKLILSDKNINTKIIDNIVYMKNYYSNDLQLLKLYKFLSKKYYDWFLSRTKYWAIKTNCTYNKIIIKKLKKVWGYRKFPSNDICYNIQIIHYPIEYIDSLIIHELIHEKYKNHSNDFYEEVLKYIPDYWKISSELNF